ncbi:MAG: hypothetical protein JSV88_28010 [Candidatus Aminicenantes bacterium]|nr:MAG: hypothetical protein JSV88_28010 [Candidatus Aminicenantes bacterium]
MKTGLKYNITFFTCQPLNLIFFIFSWYKLKKSSRQKRIQVEIIFGKQKSYEGMGEMRVWRDARDYLLACVHA